MQLSNSFTIARPVQEVYDAFLDIDRIATCMPGSTLLGQSGEDTYDGEVKVKVGPLSVTYTGQFTILEKDPAAHTLTMRAKGREKKGAGNADAHIVATLSEENGVTTVHLATELNIRGKVAQFGGGAIGDVTDSIMQAFAGNVEQMLLSGATPTGTETATTPPTAPTPTRQETNSETATAITTEPASVESKDLDVWSLVVRPVLQRHASSIVTVAAAGLAAYLGARSARAGRGAQAEQLAMPRRYYYY